LVLAGMGLDGILDAGARAGHFKHILENLGSFERGSEEWLAEAFLKTTKGDPEALLLLLDSFVDTTLAQLAAIGQPTLVVAGEEDQDNGSAEALAARLPDARHVAVPGGHMSAVTKPDLGRAIAEFLAA
jgi:pimeloyl-ACP methyl ester carboxylesterase